MTETNQEYDRKDLKIMALLEKTASLQSENADLRVELTIVNQELESIRQEPKASETKE